MKTSFDPSEYGGAPLLGLSKPVIKAHGGSNAKAFKNAIRKAADFTSAGVHIEIAKWVEADAAKNAGSDSADSENKQEISHAE